MTALIRRLVATSPRYRLALVHLWQLALACCLIGGAW